MNYLEKYIVAKLQEMQTEKAEKFPNKIPNMVTKREIYDAIIVDAKAVLNKLFHERKIKVHKTKDAPINDYVEYVGGQENG